MADEKPKKSGGCATMIVAVAGGFILVMLGLALCAPDMTQSPGQPQKAAADPGQTIPWFTQVRTLCARYDQAPNEIKQSAIFNEGMAILRKASAGGLRGTLTMISTDQGGGELAISMDANLDRRTARFATDSLLAPIKKGSPVYLQVSELREGQCVVVEVDRIEPSSVLERSKLCDDEFFARFTDVKPCAAPAGARP